MMMQRKKIVEELLTSTKHLLDSLESLMCCLQDLELLTRVLAREEMDKKEDEDA